MRWSPSNHRLWHPSRQHLRTTPKARCAWRTPHRSLYPSRASNSPDQEPKRRKLRQRLQRRKTPSQPLQQHRLTPQKKTARPRSRPTPKARNEHSGDTKCGKTPHATRPGPFGGAHKASSAAKRGLFERLGVVGGAGARDLAGLFGGAHKASSAAQQGLFERLASAKSPFSQLAFSTVRFPISTTPPAA